MASSSTLPDLCEQNSTNAPLETLNYLSKIKHEPKEFLLYHQLLVSKYFANFPHSRGLLLYHEVGSGKTIIGASLAVHFSEKGLKVIILAPKSLQDNFRQGINQYIKNTHHTALTDKFKYVSLNANNLMDQLGRLDKSKEIRKFEKNLGDFSAFIRQKNAFNDCLLIIDEAHNLSNGVANGSKNAVGLYDMILNARNLKILLLTGTPIVNDAFELGILFNMIKGPIYSGKIRGTLFPEIRPEFERYFVDRKTMKIKNVNMFINRCYGLSSHYGSLYTKINTDVKKSTDSKKNIKHKSIQREGYPIEYELKVIQVNMSGEQFSRYDSARDREKEETATGPRSDDYERFNKKSGSTTYRIASRQVSNYVIPFYALGPAKSNKAREKFIKKITDADLKKLDIYSPKFKKILENIHNHSGIAVVYSDFVTGEGINLFARVLNISGYSEWKPKDLDSVKSWVTPTKGAAEYPLHDSVAEWEYSDEFDPTAESDQSNNLDNSGSYDSYSSHDETFQYGGYVDDLTFYGGKSKRYAKLTGELDTEDRTKLLEYFNNPKNKTGDLVKILLLSGAGSEGITILNARSIHIMNPYWNMARLFQVKARAIRFKSHEALPKKDRTIQPYMYLSTYPKGFDKQWKQKQAERSALGLKVELLEKTTDVELYEKSLLQKRLNDYFLASVIRASIDCSIHAKSLSESEKKRINCLMCNPTGHSLYNPVIKTQLQLDNPCQQYKKERVKAKEFKIDFEDGKGEQSFYYIKDGDDIVIFSFNKNSDAYVQLNPSDEYYYMLHEKLEKEL